MEFRLGSEILELMACAEMKWSHEPWHRSVFINIAMYPTICKYDDKAFDNMNEDSKKTTTLSFRSCCVRSVPSQGIVEEAK